ncbi:hypothetical protein [Sphingomonas sp.]|uniref:hypothetical protein n=1 Tax=Sphingomonas sp. TaxID=28214 RepID=UPI003AFF7BA0
MDYKGLSKGLGWFSLALGATELLFAERITKALEADGHEGLVRGFGAREVVAGLGLLDAPAHSVRVWNRVAGDAADMAALAAAARKSPGNRAVWGAIAFVAGAAILDAWVAIGLDRQTGEGAS